MTKYEASKEALTALGMIPDVEISGQTIFYSPDKSFKYAAVLLSKKEIEEKNTILCLPWDDKTPFIPKRELEKISEYDTKSLYSSFFKSPWEDQMRNRDFTGWF